MRLLDFVRHFPDDLTMHLCVTGDRRSLLPEFQKYTANITFVVVKRPYMEPGKIRIVHEYVRENRIEVVNTFDLKGLLIAVVMKLFLNCRARIIHHVVNLLQNYRPHQRLLLFLLLQVVDGVISNSETARRNLRGFIRHEKVQTIHNGVDTSLFRRNGSPRSLRQMIGISDDEIIVGTVANFKPEKNYPFLISAFARLSQLHPNLRLLCVGGGSLLEPMRRLAQAHTVSDKVVFCGHVQDVREYLNIMDIFVLCSTKESFPNVLIQAMSMALPVVASHVGGCPEIVDHLHDGLLFKLDAADEFPNWISKLVNDKTLSDKLGRNARSKVEKLFSLETMIWNYSKFFRSLATERV